MQLERDAQQIVGRSGEVSTSIITGVTLGRLMFAWFKSGGLWRSILQVNLICDGRPPPNCLVSLRKTAVSREDSAFHTALDQSCGVTGGCMRDALTHGCYYRSGH